MRTGKSLIWTKVCYRPDGGFKAGQMNPTDSKEEEMASEQNLATLVGGTFSNGYDDFPISHFVMCLYPHPFFTNINVKRFKFIQFHTVRPWTESLLSSSLGECVLFSHYVKKN